MKSTPNVLAFASLVGVISVCLVGYAEDRARPSRQEAPPFQPHPRGARKDCQGEKRGASPSR